MNKRFVFPILLTTIGVLGGGFLLWWLFFTGGDHRIMEKSDRIVGDPVTTVKVPIGETLYVHIGTLTGSSVEKAELWDPNGNLVSTQFPQDKRSPLDRLSDYWAGSGLIYRVDFSLWQPMEGEWQIRIFEVHESGSYMFDFYADARSDIALKVELGHPQKAGEAISVPVIARLYRGNELICDENLQMEAEVRVQGDASPKIHALQSDDNCVFTGSSGLMELGDLGFYVIAQHGFVRRQLFFDKPD